MERFTKEEDRVIMDSYMTNGFHLTKSCIEDLSLLLNRTEKSIRNRMTRYLIKQYKGFLNKDFHIRVTLLEKLGKGVTKQQSVDEILNSVAIEFMVPYDTLCRKFRENENQYWGKHNIYSNFDGVPNNKAQLMEILEKEDSEYHLYTDIIEANKEEQRKQGFFKKLWLKAKGIFK